MNIAMMTSWNCPCGIAKYSQKLVYAYEKQFDDKWYVFANKTESTRNGRIFPETFIVKWWNEGEAFVDIERINKLIENLRIDLLHIQFQQTFFTMPVLEQLINDVTIPVVVTYHDSCSYPKMKLPKTHAMGIVQRREMIDHYAPAVYWQHPYDEFKPTVFTHGLGRNNGALIKKVCDELGIAFECHDSKVDGWLSEEMLMLKMQNADAIVCWYSDMGAITGDGWYRIPVAGSGAVRTAISSFRPVFINDCKWFEDVPSQCVHRVSSAGELKSGLAKLFNLDETRSNSYEKFAEKHHNLYQEIINGK